MGLFYSVRFLFRLESRGPCQEDAFCSTRWVGAVAFEKCHSSQQFSHGWTNWRILAISCFQRGASYLRQTGSGCIPLWLWGDDCRFNEQGHKIVIIAMGAVLDERKSSKDTVYPLLCYQVETFLKLVYLLLKNTSPLAHPIPLPQSSQGAKFGFQNFASLLETGPMAAYSGFVQWTCQPQWHLEKPGCNIHDFLFR